MNRSQLLAILFILIILIIVYVLYRTSTIGVCQEGMSNLSNINNSKPKLWSYWELKPGHTHIPDYIDLCFETFRKHCSKLFDVIILNENTVKQYIPDLRTDINQLNLAAKSDYIRVVLLYRYGGVWLDADTIVMTDLHEILDKLEIYDFVGFGCTGEKCTKSGYPNPSNGAMGSRKSGVLMGNVLKRLDRELDNYFAQSVNQRKQLGYFDFGKIIIWKELDKLIKTQNYQYYHFPSSADGSRDTEGNWVAPELIFKKNIHLMDPNKLLIVFLANSIYCGNDPKYNWFCKLSKSEILKGDYFVSSLFRKSLNIKKN